MIQCIKCGHGKELSPYGKCLYVDLDNNSQVCECRCEFSQPSPSVALEAAKEIAGLFPPAHVCTFKGCMGNQNDREERIAAIISKHLSRGEQK